MVVLRARDAAQLAVRTRLLASAIEGIGLRTTAFVCEDPDSYAALEDLARRQRIKLRLETRSREPWSCIPIACR